MTDIDTSTFTPVGDPPAGVPPRTPHVAGARAAAAGFLVAIAVPFVAYLGGVRAPATENRVQTPAPALSGVASLDDGALAQLTDHLTETLPGRQAAVRVNAYVDRTLFRQSPNTEVLLGRDSWLFLAKSVDVHCRADGEIGFLRSELTRAQQLVEGTGRDWRVIVPPNKATVYPDELGSSARLAECGLATSAQLRDQLEHDPPRGYLPLWDAVDAMRDRSATPIYFDIDTHWTSGAAIEMVRRIVTSFDPTLLDDAEVVPGRTVTYTGDLARLIGLGTEITETIQDVQRPGVTWQARHLTDVSWLAPDIDPRDVEVTRSEGAAVVPGRTVLVHDSFAQMSQTQLAPFFEELAMIHRNPTSVTWVGDAVAAADHVVLEVVERSLWQTVVEDGLVASLAVALEDELPHREASVAPDDEGWFELDPAGDDVVTVDHIGERPSGAPYALEVELPSGDTLQVDRRPEVRTEAPLVFDLRRYADGGAQRFRIIDAHGTPLTPHTLALISTH